MKRWIVLQYQDGTIEHYFPSKGIAINLSTGKVRTCKVIGLVGR